MFLQRNTASQVFTIPGTLRVIADGTAVTAGASLTWIKDGTSGAAAGTLTHVSDGGYTYAPTQGETDAKILGWILTKAGAAGLAGSVRTTNADPNDATRLGLGALPNAAAEAAGGLYTRGTGAGQINQDANGRIDANAKATLGTAFTEGAAGRLAGSISAFGNVASPVLTAASVNQTGDAYAVVNSGTFGNSALLSAVQNVQNNTFIATSIPGMLERPDAGSATVNISIVFSDETGTAKNLDSGSPTIALVNDAGTDLSSRLGSITNPATGKYVVPYTNASGDALEGLHWDITGTVNTKARRMVAYTQIVDTTAVDFTAADRTKLNRIDTDYTTARAGKLDNLDAAISTREAADANLSTMAVRWLGMVALNGSVYQYTANALALGPAGGGGSGLTAQQTRDAMLLAPTGTAAPGSIDDILATLVPGAPIDETHETSVEVNG
jgi:hypothetical protein